ncbi:MAG: hypothetical protein LN412_00180 [Candidatus Thermoplasmatota archaeon]|nr:hypothetical protein [Candidatus Thermoplasmatota archaeon]
MAKGALEEFILDNIGVRPAIDLISKTLKKSAFKILESGGTDSQGYLKAIWGGKLKSYFIGKLPFGKLIKPGKRLGAEVEVTAHGSGSYVRLLIVPYMELWNRPEVFFISQGILEKLTDDSFSRRKLEEVMARLKTPIAR